MSRIYCHNPEDEPNEEQLLLLHSEGNCDNDCSYCEEE